MIPNNIFFLKRGLEKGLLAFSAQNHITEDAYGKRGPWGILCIKHAKKRVVERKLPLGDTMHRYW